MGAIWAAIPLKWKVGILVGGFGLLFLTATIAGSIAYLYSESKDHARLECKTAEQGATIAAMQSAQKEILNEFLRLQAEEDLINAAPDADDGPLAPVLRDQLKRMR